MKKMEVKICASSFLIPNNKSWEKLKKISKLSFSEYSDWINFFSISKENQTLFSIIFLQDLYDNFIKESESEKFSKFYFEILTQRLKSCRSRVVVCVSSFTNSNLLQTNKRSSLNSLKFLKQAYDTQRIYDHLVVIELDNIFSKIGYNQIFDERNWYFAHCRLSSKGLDELAKIISRLCQKFIIPPKKLLVLDCDNTLWGGVIGEDGINSILVGEDGIGKIFENFQKEIKRLSREGVLLALASKNNENDVLEVFRKKKMILTIKDFVTWRINWEDKYKNIISIAKELNIGLESIVFWDDNPLERDHVKTILKEVNIVQTPKSIYDWPNFLKTSDLFSKFKLTQDDLKKKEQYKKKALFDKHILNANSKTMYLKSIKLSPKKVKIDSSNIVRAEQLSNKTNQFNLTARRYNQEEILSVVKGKKNYSFMVKLNDVYGDHGIVGLVILKVLENDFLFIDTFLMSCRVIGRYLENWMLYEVVKLAKINNLKFIIGHFVKTKKNTIVKNFYQSNQFKNLNKEVLKNLKFNQSKIDSYFISNISKKNIQFLNIYE